MGPHLRLYLLWGVVQSYQPRPRHNVPNWNELPERRDGSPWGGLIAPPTFSLRVKGAKDLAPPPCTGETRGGNYSPPDVVIMADEGTPTRVSLATDRFSCSLTLPRPKDVARGFVLGPLTRGRGLNSIPQAAT